MNLGKNLRRILDERNITVAVLAEKTEIPAKTIYHWLAGQSPRKIEALFSICDYLEISIEELYSRPRKVSTQQLNQELLGGSYEIILRPMPVATKQKK